MNGEVSEFKPRASVPPSEPEFAADIREIKRTLARLEPVIMRLGTELHPLPTREDLAGVGRGLHNGLVDLSQNLARKASRRDLWIVAATAAFLSVITMMAAGVATLRYLIG
jgi:hypothetical protein